MFYFIKLILVIILFLWLVLLFFEVEWGRDLEGVGCCHSSHDSAEFQNILELPSLTGCAHSLHLCSNHDLRICDITACYRFRTRNTDMDMMTSWCSPLPVGPDPLSCFFVIVVFSLCMCWVVFCCCFGCIRNQSQALPADNMMAINCLQDSK